MLITADDWLNIWTSEHRLIKPYYAIVTVVFLWTPIFHCVL